MMEDLSVNFSRNLRDLREARGFTREALAELVDCTNTTIYKWESKGNKPTFVDFYKLMKALNVTFEELAGLHIDKEEVVKPTSLNEALKVLSDETGIILKLPKNLIQEDDLSKKIKLLNDKELELLKKTVDKMISSSVAERKKINHS